MRQLGSFLPGTGLGGAGVHWNGQTWRFQASRFPAAQPSPSSATARTSSPGADDPGLGRDLRRARTALRPLRIPARRLAARPATSRGRSPGGNPFEGAALARLPEPADQAEPIRRAVPQGGGGARLHPFPAAVANMTPALHQPRGRAAQTCMFCGYLRALRLRALRQGEPADDLLPVLLEQKNFELRTGAQVLRVKLTPDRKAAPPASPMSTATGKEFEQPAELVVLSRLRAQQRAADAAVRHRHAVRPGERERRRSAATTPTRRWAASRCSTTGRQHQPVHGRRARSAP